MARIVIDLALDGVTPFTISGRNYTWSGSNGNIDRISEYLNAVTDTYDLTFTLSGNQRIRSWETGFYNFAIDDFVAGSSMTIRDVADGGNRRIDFLRLSPGTNTLDLQNTRVEAITMFPPLAVIETVTTITLGVQNTRMIELPTGRTTINAGSGFVSTTLLGSGNDVVNAGAGLMEFVRLGDGNDRFTGGTGSSRTVDLGAGNDVFIGGAGTVQFVTLGEGNDTFTGGTGFVDYIDAGAGNDLVTLGAGGARFVGLGDGNDVVRLVTMRQNTSAVIRGNAGTDTLDLSRITQAVFVDLSKNLTFQDIGRPDGATTGTAGAIGYLAVNGFETVIGTAFNDMLTGCTCHNVLEGGAGNDTLSGIEGRDTLAGGKGNDVLIGGADADTFRFARKDGRDRIIDFEVGLDKIQIAGVSRLGQITFTELGGGGGDGGGVAVGVRLVANGTTITVEGVTLAQINDAGNFLF